MIEATTVVLIKIADAFLGALFGKVADEFVTRLRGDPAQQALRQAVGAAIQRYATTGTRIDLAEPLLRRDGLLTQPAIAAELAEIVRPGHMPDLALIGDRWRAELDDPPAWRNFTMEAGYFVGYLSDELRNTPVFRPVFDSESLDAIATAATASAEKLAAVEVGVANLTSMIDARFGGLIRSFDHAPFGVRDQIRDFSRYIEEKTRGFVGRRFVFDALSQFMREHPRGYFVVRGDPGIGKSALTAQLVKTGGHVHHFNIRAEGISKADSFLRNVCAQLIACYDLPHTMIPPEATQDAGFLNRLLSQISDRIGSNDQALIVVDALDEVDSIGQPTGANILFLPTTLPPNIYFAITMRNEPLQLRIECEQQTLDIEQDSPGNMADVRAYVEQAAGRPAIQAYAVAQAIETQRLVDLLVEKSQGNFMYLRYVLPEIEDGAYKDLNLDQLPAGLQNYYDDHWTRMRGQNEETWFAYKLPIVMALTQVKEPVSIDLIADFSGVQERPRIRTVLQEWRQFLYEELVAYEGGLQKRYRIYHASFHDFIAAKEEIVDERVSRIETNRKIARSLLSDLYGGQ